MVSDIEIMNRGIHCLLEKLVDAITPLIKELKILGEYAESKNDL